MDETGRYTAVFDPLDGSSNVDAGIPTGTIFGIFESGDALCILPEEGCEEPPTEADKGCEVESEATEQCLAATLQPGTSLVASGYCLYSSSCFFALTLGDGVQIFALDSMIGEFVLTHANVKLPTRGSIYSMNEVSLVLVTSSSSSFWSGHFMDARATQRVVVPAGEPAAVGRAAAAVRLGDSDGQGRERREVHLEVRMPRSD